MPKAKDKVSPGFHSYIGIGGLQRNPSCGGLRRVTLLACFALLGGCSVSMPMASLMPAHYDDETGSIPDFRSNGWLDDADWRRAKPAFDKALAEKAASAESWNNPDSGAKGKFRAVGQAFAGSVGMCRGFHATVVESAANRALEGTACADKAGNWQVTNVKRIKQG